MAKKKVYVSSTFKDLEEHRKVVKVSLERAGFDVECMEKYSAFDERPVDKCLKDVADCDYYVLIIAWRYGFQPTDDNPDQLSITEMEYRRATEEKKPSLVFLIDPEHPWSPGRIDPDALSPDSKIKKFQQAVGTAHGIRTFTNPESLASAVQEALRAEEQKHLSAPEQAKAQIRDDYLAWLRETCASVDLLGLTLKESQNVRLGQVYVPAVTQVQLDTGIPEAPRRYLALLIDRLGDSSLYVPGAPGSGKSTFCRWLAYLSADGPTPNHLIEVPEELRETLPASLTGRLPLLCPLRTWSERPERLVGKGNWTSKQLEDSLADWIDATRPGELTSPVFREELAAGRALLILDGVDEIPESLPGGYLPRHNFISGLADALPDWLKRGNRVLLTSRPYGLTSADRQRLRLGVAALAELSTELQTTFVQRWFAAADPGHAVEKAEGLLQHLYERDELAELRQNPMLLTALCIMWDQGKQLPQDFYRLYDAVIGQVLYKRYPTENQRDRARARLEAVALGMHLGSQRERTTPVAEVDIEEIDRHLAAYSQRDLISEGGVNEAADKREDLLSNSGLLLPRDGGRAAFYHLSFQEFLAAERLRRIAEPVPVFLQQQASVPAWRRSLRFLFCATADRGSPEAAICAFESLADQLDPNALTQNPNPALLFCDCLEVAHARGWNLDRFAKPLRAACDHALDHLDPPETAHLWATLGRLMWDERPGVSQKDGIPEIEWLKVPEGEFLYGERKELHHLPGYWIARFPITNAQFQCFVDDGGYSKKKWWDGLAEKPNYNRSKWDISNAPRENISWYEAIAFVRWLHSRLFETGRLPLKNGVVRLPTEEEWERVAVGISGCEYPWGDFDTARANVDEPVGGSGQFRIGKTTAVGIYKLGGSEIGAMDQAGNVWEWCLNEYDHPKSKRTSGTKKRAVRGGSWKFSSNLARTAYRLDFSPDYRDCDLGFRVVCAVS